MPFHEKTAWIMTVALLLGGAFYVGEVVTVTSRELTLAAPSFRTVGVYTAILVTIAVIGHILIAAVAPREANGAVDERERRIFERAGHWAGVVMGFWILPSLGVYLFTGDGNLLFYMVFASLMVGQIAEYLLQIIFYRTRM